MLFHWLLLGVGASRPITKGFSEDHPRNYSASIIAQSVWHPPTLEDLVAQRRRHVVARTECQALALPAACSTKSREQPHRRTTRGPVSFLDSLGVSHECLKHVPTGRTGGFCLFPGGPNLTLSGRPTVPLPNGYVPPDGRLLKFIVVSIFDLAAAGAPGSRRPLSVLDLGAGVGQYGHALLSLRPHTRWMGFDGAGNVEEMSNGFVGYADLTLPAALPRADWVVSLEVAEHVTSVHEATLVRNLHVHNCRGVIISWAALGQKGTGHVNNHGQHYIVSLFDELGYDFDARQSRDLRADRGPPATTTPGMPPLLSKNYPWFRKSIYVFRRRMPLTGIGCTS